MLRTAEGEGEEDALFQIFIKAHLPLYVNLINYIKVYTYKIGILLLIEL